MDHEIILYLVYRESCVLISCFVCSRCRHIVYSPRPLYCVKHAIYVHVGTEKNRQLINVSELSEEIGKVWSTLFFCFYVFMDKIYTSAFKEKKKVTPLKKLMMSPGFHNSFRYLFIVYLFEIQYNRFHLYYSTPKNIVRVAIIILVVV